MNLQEVKVELERISTRITEYETASAQRRLTTHEGPAVIRASMDLTNVLAKLRRQPRT